MHFLQAINSDISVLIVCNKTGGTIKGDIKKMLNIKFFILFTHQQIHFLLNSEKFKFILKYA